MKKYKLFKDTGVVIMTKEEVIEDMNLPTQRNQILKMLHAIDKGWPLVNEEGKILIEKL